LFGFSSYFAGVFTLKHSKMTSTQVQTAIDNALQELYSKVPQGESITLLAPIEVIIFDQQYGDHIPHRVTSVSKEGIALFLNNDDHDEETSDQEASYYIHDTDESVQILDIFQAVKEARPDLFTDQTKGAQ